MVSGDGSARLVNPSSLRLECGCIRGGAFYPAPLSKKRVFRISVPSPHHLHRKTNEYNPCLVRTASFGTRLKSILLRSGQEGSNPQGHQPRGSSSLSSGSLSRVGATEAACSELTLACIPYFPRIRMTFASGIAVVRYMKASSRPFVLRARDIRF